MSDREHIVDDPLPVQNMPKQLKDIEDKRRELESVQMAPGDLTLRGPIIEIIKRLEKITNSRVQAMLDQ